MSFIAAAAIIGGGALVGSLVSANASGKAASAEEGAAENSTQAQLQMFNTIEGLEAPGRNLGYGADSMLAQLYGIPNPNTSSSLYPANTPLGANGAPVAGTIAGTTPAAAGAGASAAAAPNYASFYNSPGYQFTLQQGEQAINRQAAAGGSLYSSSTLNSLGNYAQGVASQQYNNYVGQLMQMAGLGSAATGTTAQAATSAGTNISANDISAGNAAASGILGSASAISGGLGTASSAFGQSLTLPAILSAVSDRRLKTHIRRIHTLRSGLPLYSFRYVGSDVQRVGVMADEAERLFPDAVTVGADGYKRVYYSRVH